MSLYDDVCKAEPLALIERSNPMAKAARQAERFFKWFQNAMEWKGKISFRSSPDGPKVEKITEALVEGPASFQAYVQLNWSRASNPAQMSSLFQFTISDLHAGFTVHFLGMQFDGRHYGGDADVAGIARELIYCIESGLLKDPPADESSTVEQTQKMP